MQVTARSWSRALFTLAIWLAFSPLLGAANRLSIPRLVLPVGTASTVLPVLCSHEVALSGFSLGIRYRPAELSVIEVTVAGTSVEKLEYWASQNDPLRGEIVCGAVLDLTLPLTSLPPAADHTVARLVVNVLAGAGIRSPVELVDGLGANSISNMLVDEGGKQVEGLQLQSGQVAVLPTGYLPPVAVVGRDLAGAERAKVTLDGSRSRASPGLSLSYRWSQVSGPAASLAGRCDAAKTSYSLPAVDGDTPLEFELVVDDGFSRASARLAVTDVDLGIRKAEVGRVEPGQAVLLEGGRRALLFQGDLSWKATVEGGVWKRVRFTPGSGADFSLAGSCSLYLDSNRNGSLDPEDGQLGTAETPSSNNGGLTFDFVQPLAAGGKERFFLVVDLAPGGKSGSLSFDLLKKADLVLEGKTTGVRITASGIPLAGPTLEVGRPFIRGDANGDSAVNIADVNALVDFLFLGGGPICLDAADASDDGVLLLDDIIQILEALFSGRVLPPPTGSPGFDPTPDQLGCAVQNG